MVPNLEGGEFRRLGSYKYRIIVDNYNSPKAKHQPGDRVNRRGRLGTVVSHNVRYVFYRLGGDRYKLWFRDYSYTVAYDDGHTLKYQCGLNKA